MINSYEADIKVLEDEVCHLEAKNASLTMNLNEEVIQCETLHNKLKDTLESLDSLQNKFEKLEMKHMKTCSDLKSLKDDYNDLTKEFTQSNISVKTLKKGD